MKSPPLQIEFTVTANTAFGLYEQAVNHLCQLFEVGTPAPRWPADLERVGLVSFQMDVSQFAKTIDGQVRLWEGSVKAEWRQP